MAQHKLTWVLVADGARGRIFAARQGARKLAQVGPDYKSENRRTREIGSDQPGRVFDRAGPGHHAMEPRIDWHRQEKQQFVAELAERVNSAGQKGEFEALVVVAPPETLGALRKALNKHALELVNAEVEKDLTKLTVHELVPHLSQVIPPLSPPRRASPGRSR